MDVVVALHSSAALLLIVAGIAKVLRPAPTSDLLIVVGLPATKFAAMAIGVSEMGVGLIALAIGGPAPAAATGVLYVGFVLVVWRALAAGATSCGCFGRVDAPPSRIHILGNIALAAVSFVAIGGRSPVEIMDGQPAAGVGFVMLVGVLAGLALVAFTALPEALGARKGSVAPVQFRLDLDLDEEVS